MATPIWDNPNGWSHRASLTCVHLAVYNQPLDNEPQVNAATQLTTKEDQTMELGAFSISLAVADIEASRVFHEKLGFEVVGGDASENWLIIRNHGHTIGLFQGMFEKNMLTFNPGWDDSAQPLDTFADVRELQRRLKAEGINPAVEADENSAGPASFVVFDPDGNPILLDQHV